MVNEVQCRGYIGSIEASPEDGVLYGQLHYIRSQCRPPGENTDLLTIWCAEPWKDLAESQ